VTSDFIRHTAELNRQVLDLSAAIRADAARAMLGGDPNQLAASLQDALELLDAVVRDLTESRAKDAAIYATDPAFRAALDAASARSNSNA